MSIVDSLRADLERDIEEWRTEDSALKPVGESLVFGVLGAAILWRLVMWSIVARETDSWRRPRISVFGSPFDLEAHWELAARSLSMLSAGFLFAAQYPYFDGIAEHPVVAALAVANLFALYLDPFYMIQNSR